MSKHTKGPWFVSGPYHIQAPTPADGVPVIVGSSITLRSLNREERAANARLMAAAPVLKDALESVLFLVMDQYGPGYAEIENAKAVLAKVEGEV